jgi:hypothetical protein
LFDDLRLSEVDMMPSTFFCDLPYVFVLGFAFSADCFRIFAATAQQLQSGGDTRTIRCTRGINRVSRLAIVSIQRH